MYSFFAWIISSISTLASLYQSEILYQVPCLHCWYSRIFLFPLPILLFQALYFDRKEFLQFILPLPILGILPSSFLLYKKFSHCNSCTITSSTPLLSFITFILIIILISLALVREKNACSKT